MALIFLWENTDNKYIQRDEFKNIILADNS